MICQVFATYLPRFRNDSAMEKIRLRKPCKIWFRSWFTSRIWWSDLLFMRVMLSVSQSMYQSDFTSDQPRFCNVFAKILKCNSHAILQHICTCIAMHSPGLRKAFARSLLPCRKARAPRVKIKIPQLISHVFATCLPRFGNVFAESSCNAYVKVSQCTHQVFARCLPGASDQEALIAPLEPSARHRRKAASDLPHVCNVHAKVWECLRTDILQCICNGFA
jgi:hypothetical protein